VIICEPLVLTHICHCSADENGILANLVQETMRKKEELRLTQQNLSDYTTLEADAFRIALLAAETQDTAYLLLLEAGNIVAAQTQEVSMNGMALSSRLADLLQAEVVLLEPEEQCNSTSLRRDQECGSSEGCSQDPCKRRSSSWLADGLCCILL